MQNEDPKDMIQPQVGGFLQLYLQGKKFSSIFFNFNTNFFCPIHKCGDSNV